MLSDTNRTFNDHVTSGGRRRRRSLPKTSPSSGSECLDNTPCWKFQPSTLILLATACIALGMQLTAGNLCEFIRVKSKPGEILAIVQTGRQHITTSASVGLFRWYCDFYNLQEDSMYKLGRSFFLGGLGLGCLAAFLTICVAIQRRKVLWHSASLAAALAALCQVPSFLVFESFPCVDFRLQQECELGTGSFFAMASIACWVVFTALTQCLDPPDSAAPGNSMDLYWRIVIPPTQDSASMAGGSHDPIFTPQQRRSSDNTLDPPSGPEDAASTAAVAPGFRRVSDWLPRPWGNQNKRSASTSADRRRTMVQQTYSFSATSRSDNGDDLVEEAFDSSVDDSNPIKKSFQTFAPPDTSGPSDVEAPPPLSASYIHAAAMAKPQTPQKAPPPILILDPQEAEQKQQQHPPAPMRLQVSQQKPAVSAPADPAPKSGNSATNEETMSPPSSRVEHGSNRSTPPVSEIHHQQGPKTTVSEITPDESILDTSGDERNVSITGDESLLDKSLDDISADAAKAARVQAAKDAHAHALALSGAPVYAALLAEDSKRPQVKKKQHQEPKIVARVPNSKKKMSNGQSLSPKFEDMYLQRAPDLLHLEKEQAAIVHLPTDPQTVVVGLAKMRSAETSLPGTNTDGTAIVPVSSAMVSTTTKSADLSPQTPSPVEETSPGTFEKVKRFGGVERLLGAGLDAAAAILATKRQARDKDGYALIDDMDVDDEPPPMKEVTISIDPFESESKESSSIHRAETANEQRLLDNWNALFDAGGTSGVSRGSVSLDDASQSVGAEQAVANVSTSFEDSDANWDEMDPEAYFVRGGRNDRSMDSGEGEDGTIESRTSEDRTIESEEAVDRSASYSGNEEGDNVDSSFDVSFEEERPRRMEEERKNLIDTMDAYLAEVKNRLREERFRQRVLKEKQQRQQRSGREKPPVSPENQQSAKKRAGSATLRRKRRPRRRGRGDTSSVSSSPSLLSYTIEEETAADLVEEAPSSDEKETCNLEEQEKEVRSPLLSSYPASPSSPRVPESLNLTSIHSYRAVEQHKSERRGQRDDDSSSRGDFVLRRQRSRSLDDPRKRLGGRGNRSRFRSLSPNSRRKASSTPSQLHTKLFKAERESRGGIHAAATLVSGSSGSSSDSGDDSSGRGQLNKARKARMVRLKRRQSIEDQLQRAATKRDELAMPALNPRQAMPEPSPELSDIETSLSTTVDTSGDTVPGVENPAEETVAFTANTESTTTDYYYDDSGSEEAGRMSQAALPPKSHGADGIGPFPKNPVPKFRSFSPAPSAGTSESGNSGEELGSFLLDTLDVSLAQLSRRENEEYGVDESSI